MTDTQRAKEFLRKVRDELREVRLLRAKREEIRLSLMPSGIRYDMDRVQSSPMDALPESVARMCELDEELRAHLKDMDARRAEAVRVIRHIDDPALRMVLEVYYLSQRANGKPVSWDDVEEVTGYSKYHVVKRLHPKALAQFGEWMQEGASSGLKDANKCQQMPTNDH